MWSKKLLVPSFRWNLVLAAQYLTTLLASDVWLLMGDIISRPGTGPAPLILKLKVFSSRSECKKTKPKMNVVFLFLQMY